MSIAVSSSIGQLNYKPPYIKLGNNFFKKGAVYLNGKKVFIGGSLEQTARKINKQKAVTGIQAEVKDKRLVLLSKKTIVNIRDTKKLLQQFFKDKQIGTKNTQFIQFVKKGVGSNIILNYNTKTPASVGGLKLSIPTSIIYKSSLLFFPAQINAMGEDEMREENLELHAEDLVLDGLLLAAEDLEGGVFSDFYSDEEELFGELAVPETTLIIQTPEKLAIAQSLFGPQEQITLNNGQDELLDIQYAEEQMQPFSMKIETKQESIDDDESILQPQPKKIVQTSAQEQLSEQNTVYQFISQNAINSITKHFKDQGQELLSVRKAEIIQTVVSGLKNSNMSFEEIQENQGKISDHVKLFMMQCANPVRLNFARKGKFLLEISNSSKLQDLVAGLTLDKLRYKPAPLNSVFLELNKKTRAIVKSFSSNEQFLKFDALCRALSADRQSLVKIGNFVAVRDFEIDLMLQKDKKSTSYKMGELIVEFKTSRAKVGAANIAQVISKPQNIAIILWTYMKYSNSPTLLADYISKNDISRMLANVDYL